MATKNVNISSDDDRWTRIVVNYYNNEEKRHLNADFLVDSGSGVINYPPKLHKRLVEEFGNRITRFRQDKKTGKVTKKVGAAGEPHFPPGRDKIRAIIKNWIDNGEATQTKKEGIILNDSIDLEIIQPYRIEMLLLRDKIKELSNFYEEEKQFGVHEFIKCELIKIELFALPLSTELKNHDVSPGVQNNIYNIQKDWIKEQLDELKKIRRKQTTLWLKKNGKKDFKACEKYAKIYLSFYHNDVKDEFEVAEQNLKALVHKNKRKSTKKK